MKRSQAYLEKLTNYIIYGNFISDTFYFLSNWGIEHFKYLSVATICVFFF